MIYKLLYAGKPQDERHSKTLYKVTVMLCCNLQACTFHHNWRTFWRPHECILGNWTKIWTRSETSRCKLPCKAPLTNKSLAPSKY